MSTQKKQIEQEIERIKQVFKSGKPSPELYNDLGVGYLLLGKYEEAISQLKMAVELAPDSISYLYNLGNAYSESEQPEHAKICYYDVLDKKADHLPSLNNLADCYEKTGNVEKAFEIFTYTVRVAPDNLIAHFNLGNFLLRNNRHIEAVKCYKKVIEIDNNFTDAYHNIAWVLSEVGAIKESKKYARKGLAVDSEHSELQKLLLKID